MLMGKVDGGDSQGTTPSQADQLKLPTTLEQFLEAEKLTDWPYPMALEGPFDINAEGLLLGTQDDIADILRESAPLGLGLLDDLEDRLAKVEEKLNSYAVHIITNDKRPSRLVERLFHSPTRSFITEASTSDVVKSHHSSRGHKSADFADAMMETKKRSMDYCMFPGFRHGELVELPAQLEAPPVLHKITNIQNFNMTHMHQQLANYFLASGRGRPPNPPGLTNKVLLQLQRQSGKPSSVVHSWFEKLFPEVTFPVDRIGGVIDRTEKQFKEHLSGETGTTAFLQPGFRKFWKKLFLSEASAAVMQDMFWWIFLSQFNKERGFEEEKNQLFDRIADSYVALFTSINADVKDKFLTVYPECLAQALYSAYVTAFPESRWRFDDQFKQYLINLTNEWIKGLKPVPGTWRHWDTASLEADGTGAANEANAATKKMMEAAALNKKMDVSLDMDSFHKMVARLGEEVVTPQLESREVSKLTTTGAGLTSLSRLGNAAAAGAQKKAAKESHQIGPGPEFERVKFNTQGRSPLISHYLHMRQLRDYRQPGKKVRRTEIAKLPQPGPTYQQFIQNKVAVSDALSREFTRICDTTNAEILELERKKREMYRDIDNLKKELTNAKNANERKALMDRIHGMKDRDREGTPLLDHRTESALTGSMAVSDED